jgi:hypothetical protein
MIISIIIIIIIIIINIKNIIITVPFFFQEFLLTFIINILVKF